MRRGLGVPCLALAAGLGVAPGVPAWDAPLRDVYVGVPCAVVEGPPLNVREALASEAPARRATVRSRPPSRSPSPTPWSDLITLQSPPATGSFLALDDIAALQVVPPNVSGAAGDAHLMVAVNSNVRFQDKAGASLFTETLSNFWSGVRSGTVRDPRIVYEPVARRWITVSSDITADPADAGVLVAVSDGFDPTAMWQRFKIPTSGLWPYRSTIGFNKNWVVVQANMYDGVGLVESRVWAFGRSDVFDGPPYAPVMMQLPGQLAVVPAVTYDDALQPDALHFLQTASPASGQLRLWRLTSPGSEAITPVGLVSGAPPWADAAPAANFAPQWQAGCPTGTFPCSPDCRIHVEDSRIQNVVSRQGMLWAAQTVLLPAGTPTYSAVQWWQIDPSIPAVAQQGRVEDPTGRRFFAYPSLAVNKNEDVLLGYSRFQGDEYAGASYSVRTKLDPDGTMQPERTLKDGEDCYFKDLTSGVNQWGAYSASAVDPDDTTLWTVQEYAATPGGSYDRWGTWWGAFDPTPAMVISDAVVSESVSGTSNLVFDVSLLSSDPAHSGPLPTSQTVTVAWSTYDGTAKVADNDYEAGSGTLTFAPGETTKAITVAVKSDAVAPEPDETLFVRLDPPVNATLADGEGQGTIQDLPPPQISIGDARVTEGNAGQNNDATFTITLSYPSAVDVAVTWETASGALPYGATKDVDFLGTAPPFTIPANVDTFPLKVQTIGDTNAEPDETFAVRLLTASFGTLLKPAGTGTIVDDDALTISNPPATDLVVLSDGTSSAGRNRLEWVNPTPGSTPRGIRVTFAQGASCAYPSTPGAGAWGVSTPANAFDIPFGGAGSAQRYEHNNLLPLTDEYCYAVWVAYGSGSTWSPGAAVAKARPFDASGPVKWKYFTGASDFVAPTIGVPAVLAPSNDKHVHAVERGPTGGAWPGLWKPLDLGSTAYWRSPVVTLGVGTRAFVTTYDGRVHAIDLASGNEVWSTLLPEGAATAAPAAILAAFNGGYDYILVGTKGGANDHFYALDPLNGAVIDAFPNASEPAIGPVPGMATVDYDNRRVYFATFLGASGKSLWCLDLGPRSDALRLRWSKDVGDVDGAPVLRNGRVYVGNTSNVIWSVPAAAGAGGYSLAAGNDKVKGFLFPDRNGTDFYAATRYEVLALTDDGSSLRQRWLTPLLNPSTVLLEPGTDNLYAGVENYLGRASLVKLNKLDGSPQSSAALESAPRIVGAPSLDLGFDIVKPKMIYVGGELGVLYAVQLPF